MDFIFMLTRNDETVEDCLETWALIDSVGLTHAGFKDVGAPLDTLHELNRRMLSCGVTTYLEVVSTSHEDCLRSAAVGVELGVNRLMGGTQVDEILALTRGTGVEYLPFPGVPIGHPTVLGGSAETVEQHCKEFDAAGCAGADLLAYRAIDADPLDLVRAARRGTSGYLVAAGSISTHEQIEGLRLAGADAFTIGSAIFDGSFNHRKGSITALLREALDVARG
jgi:hypothetical protein